MEVTLTFYRLGNFFHRHGVPLLPRMCTIATSLIFRAHIPSEATIGARLKVAYGGVGAVVHPRVVIGDDCLIGPGVVVGGRKADGVPRVGDGVRMYPGAKLLGDIAVGSGTVVGANAVLIESVPPATVIVAPAGRILR